MASDSIVAVSQCPRTAPCADAIAPLLADIGWHVRRFDCDSGGGALLESAVRDGNVAAVIEISITDLAADQWRLGANDRLTGAALAGLPQVIVLGGLDAALWDGPTATDRLVAEFSGRRYARTSVRENDRLGRELAYKVSASRGPAAIVAPLGGLSALDAPGEPFWNPEADAALVRSLTNWLDPNVRLVETPAHLFDVDCVRQIVAAFQCVTSR